MKTNEDRMIDFVAKSYEENRFDPKKALARSQNGSLRRSLSLSKRTDKKQIYYIKVKIPTHRKFL